VSHLYRLRQVRQAYGEPAPRVVLDLEALDIEAGEVLAVVGPSGAGKSTLLRLLNFLERPTSGTIEFDGQPVLADPPLAVLRRVTTVFQRPLMLSQSVYDNVALGLRLRGAMDGARVAAALAEVGLEALARAPAGRLSGGEMQRAALARALVLDPAVLLLDEPTANLDVKHQLDVFGVVSRLAHQDGLAVAAAIHDLDLAAEFCDRLVLLSRGSILAEGAPEAALTAEHLAEAFGVQARTYRDPFTQAMRLSLARGEHIA